MWGSIISGDYKMKKNIYEDEENKILFFKPKDYLNWLNKSIIGQIRIKSFCVQRKVCISFPFNSEMLLSLIKENPNKKKFYKITFYIKNSFSTLWASTHNWAMKKAKLNDEIFDRIFIEEYTLLNKRSKGTNGKRIN